MNLVLETPEQLADTATDIGGIFAPGLRVQPAKSGVRRIQDPKGKEARLSSCRFPAPGASADRWHGMESHQLEKTMKKRITRRQALATTAATVTAAAIPLTAAMARQRAPDADLLRLAAQLDAQLAECRRCYEAHKPLHLDWWLRTNHIEEARISAWRAGDVDRHLELKAQIDKVARDTGFDAALDATGKAWSEVYETWQALFAIPAMTPAGAAAKLRVIHSEWSAEPWYTYGILEDLADYIPNVQADLDRMALSG